MVGPQTKKYVFYAVELILLLFVSVLTFTVVLGLVDIYSTDFDSDELFLLAVEVTGVLVTLLFYLGLLHLDSQIKNIQELERRSIVELSRYSFDGDSAEIWLSNYGKGSATDLELVFEIASPTALPIHVESCPVPLRRREENQIRRETSIPPESDYVKFRATPALKIEDAVGKVRTYRNWGAAVRPLSEAGIDEIKFTLKVTYRNQLDELDAVFVTGKPRGVSVGAMGRLEGSVHGIPAGVSDPGDIHVDMKAIEPVEAIIDNKRLEDSAIKILRKINKSDFGLEISKIGIFQDQNVERRVCESLRYRELLEIRKGGTTITHRGEQSRPESYKITDKGKELLKKVDS
ncbi:hypothetical protein [Salinigranum rubrum]|uniref:hypothetical protein n=1 Tax=Salinigranum rubrum TaxID=755307 RepID=UPI0013A57375|nr:hypothetical protein [Salinigranum rubrum]